jgi:aryl-alcohol dehydrogenase-like predicted oxidoreductase
VDVCMMGAKSMKQMRENLTVLEQGPLTGDEMERVRRIGRYVYTNGRGSPSAAESPYGAKAR